MGQNQPKKLVLNRETVRDLTKDELVGIEGGKNKTPTIFHTCDTCWVETGVPCDVCP